MATQKKHQEVLDHVRRDLELRQGRLRDMHRLHELGLSDHITEGYDIQVAQARIDALSDIIAYLSDFHEDAYQFLRRLSQKEEGYPAGSYQRAEWDLATEVLLFHMRQIFDGTTSPWSTNGSHR